MDEFSIRELIEAEVPCKADGEHEIEIVSIFCNVSDKEKEDKLPGMEKEKIPWLSIAEEGKEVLYTDKTTSCIQIVKYMVDINEYAG